MFIKSFALFANPFTMKSISTSPRWRLNRPFSVSLHVFPYSIYLPHLLFGVCNSGEEGRREKEWKGWDHFDIIMTCERMWIIYWFGSCASETARSPSKELIVRVCSLVGGRGNTCREQYHMLNCVNKRVKWLAGCVGGSPIPANREQQSPHSPFFRRSSGWVFVSNCQQLLRPRTRTTRAEKYKNQEHLTAKLDENLYMNVFLAPPTY